MTKCIYLEWQKRTHGRIQAAGEEESRYDPHHGGQQPQNVLPHNRSAKQELRGVAGIRKVKEKTRKLTETKKRGTKRQGKGNQVKEGRTNNNNHYTVVPPRKKR